MGKRITITIKTDDDQYDEDEAVETVLGVLEDAHYRKEINFDFEHVVTEYPR